MHVFLTGTVQSGKSTAILSVIRQAKEKVGGFCTAFGEGRGTAQWNLYLFPASGAPIFDEAHVVARFQRGNPPHTIPSRFESLGVPLLEEAAETAQLIIMDECGRLEGEATAFQNKVLELLDGETPVLGVIRRDFNDWTEAIAQHPNVQVVQLTQENRDALPAMLLAWLNAPTLTKLGGK